VINIAIVVDRQKTFEWQRQSAFGGIGDGFLIYHYGFSHPQDFCYLPQTPSLRQAQSKVEGVLRELREYNSFFYFYLCVFSVAFYPGANETQYSPHGK